MIQRFFSFFPLILLFFILSMVGAVPAQAQSPPVLAFYYAWFDQSTWSSGQAVDTPAQPYRSADPNTIERHVFEAQSAGIDAFVQSWYGPQVENNQTETNFRLLLDIAQARGFRAAVDFEVTSPFYGSVDAVTNGLATLLATHVQHPAYLRFNGKPVIFFWRQQQYSVDQWAAIRNQLDPNRDTIWIAEGTDLSFQAVFDGHHLYSIAWAGDPAAELAKWRDRIQSYEAQNGTDQLWAATVMPGYDDTNLPRSNAFAVPRRGGDYLRETWQGAIASQPDMIIITSFNEWLEGTQLEPSAGYGNLYLDTTRELVTQLRGAAPPAPAPVRDVAPPPAESPVQQAAPAAQTPDGPYVEISGITNVRSGPGTTFEIVGRLAAGDTPAVIGQNEAGDWWLIELTPAPDGQGWVADEVVDFVGDAAGVPRVEAPAPPATVEAPAEAEATDEAGEDTAPVVEATPTPTPDNRPTITVPAGGVNVRSGPGLDFELAGRIEEETEVVVTARSETGDWWQIEYEEGEEGLGWVAAVVVAVDGETDTLPIVGLTGEVEVEAPTSTPTPPRVAGSIRATDAINIRSEPSLEGDVVGALYLGDRADVLAMSVDREWWLIDVGDEGAWIAAEFVEFEGDPERVPIFGFPTPTPSPALTNTPTVGPTATPVSFEQPTLAPTATSIYNATSAALLEARGTPDTSLTESEPGGSGFGWSDLPWGILSIVVIAGFLWYQFVGRRR